MKYVRLCNSVKDYGKLIPKDEVQSYLTDNDKEYYTSIYYYNEEHLKKFQEGRIDSKTGKLIHSVKGFTGVTTDRLVWDFDDENNNENARQDTITLCSRLLEKGLTADEFNIYFSGNKGFGVSVSTTSELTTDEFRDITHSLAEGLASLDLTLWDGNQLLRYPASKHPKSGLYKICISLNDLSNCTVEQIRELAKSVDNYHPDNTTQVILPELILSLKQKEKPKKKLTLSTGEGPWVEGDYVDFSKKPRNVPDSKWLLVHGYIKPGNKHSALMCLSAYYRSLGYPKEVTHRMIKGSFEIQHRLFPNDHEVPKENVWKAVEEVYGDGWNGGTYNSDKHPFLIENCKYFTGTSGELEQDKTLVSITEVADKFSKYAREIDKNTVKTGIDCIDKNVRLQTCSHVVIAGCSGAGKTTLILNILNNLSNSGLYGIFGSMDMNSNLIYQKLVQRVTEMSDNELYELWKSNDREKIAVINNKIDKEFKNIKFDFRSGIEIDSLRENILEAKARLGDGLKLVVLDFINRIRGPYSDETANLSYIAPRLSDLANETETLIVSLAQIARAKGGPATPLADSRIAKGSSAIEESATVLFGIWRPGYNKGVNDKYMCMSALKTRMGKEFTESLYFNGLTSEIRGLTKDEQKEYEFFIDSQKESDEKDEDNPYKGRGGF